MAPSPDRRFRWRTAPECAAAPLRRHDTPYRSIDQGFAHAAALAKGPKLAKPRVTSLTPPEARQFLDGIAGDRLEAVYRVALAVGLRRGEALGLRWADVDLDARSLTVVYALQRVAGQLVLVQPKTSKFQPRRAHP